MAHLTENSSFRSVEQGRLAACQAVVAVGVYTDTAVVAVGVYTDTAEEQSESYRFTTDELAPRQEWCTKRPSPWVSTPISSKTKAWRASRAAPAQDSGGR